MTYTVKELKDRLNKALEGLDDDTVVLMTSSNTMEQAGVVVSGLPNFKVETYKKTVKSCYDSFDGTSYSSTSYVPADEGSDEAVRALRIY